MPKARLDALHTLLAGLVARPEPGTLVIACADTEVFYLVHALAHLDEHSPADRFFTVAAPFTDLPTYLALLTAASAETPPPDGPVHTSRPDLAAHQFEPLFTRLLADLPPGDHRLVCALIPPEIADANAFAALIQALLAAPLDPRLRLVIRDSTLAPRSFELASTCPSEQVLAYRFALPPELFVRDLHSTANDPQRAPDPRAQALLQLAGHDLAHRRHADALTRCELAANLATSPALRAMALALKADALRHSGDVEAALILGAKVLRLAAAAELRPVAVHAALALADLTRELGHREQALACFHIAERAAHDPRIAAHARDARIALEGSPC